MPALADSQIVIPSTSQSRDGDAKNSDSLGTFPQSSSATNEGSSDPASVDPYSVRPTNFMQQIGMYDTGGSLWFPAGRRPSFWVSGEYLYWTADNLRTPVLVTSSPTGTARADAAFLGGPSTSILFGSGSINDGHEHGLRITASYNMGIVPGIRWEADYFQIFDRVTSFNAASDDRLAPTNIIGRPFFDLTNGQETAQLLSFAGLASGTIDIEAESGLRSYGAWGRVATTPAPGPCDFVAINSPLANRWGQIDLLLGYRHVDLDDTIIINEDLTSLDPANPGSFEIRESFATENSFDGLEFGGEFYGRLGRFSSEVVTKLAVGNNRQSVTINGFSDITEAGFEERFPGGLLAQRSNIGHYERNELAVVPQLTWKLRTQLTRYWSLSAGYNLFYFSNVVRAGDQIDTDLNPDLFPPEQPPLVVAPLRPRFRFRESDYWAHGLSFGTNVRF